MYVCLEVPGRAGEEKKLPMANDLCLAQIFSENLPNNTNPHSCKYNFIVNNFTCLIDDWAGIHRILLNFCQEHLGGGLWPFSLFCCNPTAPSLNVKMNHTVVLKDEWFTKPYRFKQAKRISYTEFTVQDVVDNIVIRKGEPVILTNTINTWEPNPKMRDMFKLEWLKIYHRWAHLELLQWRLTN